MGKNAKNKENPAAKGLLENFQQVADKSYEPSDYNDPSQISQGLSETHEQISDNYASGNNDITFWRDGKDLADQNENE
jgi:hypothetical protein